MKGNAVYVFMWLAAVICTPTPTYAQRSIDNTVSTTKRSAPDTAWQRLTEPPAFAYRNLREGYKPPTPPKPYEPSALERLIYGIIRFFGSTIGLVILWTVLIGAVAYGVWMAFFSGGRFAFARKKAPGAEEDPTEEDLHGIAWLRLMEEAISSGDTRLAVRYGYLYVLEALTDTAWIQYRPGKTNADYASELAGSEFAGDFRGLSRTYEYTWYGSYPLTATAYADYRSQMSRLENRVRS
jgi:hypothetical protein